ncbi:hypothetical protein ES708_04740 [subsurface metagenome]
MRIIRVQIKKLFGMFDHDIRLNTKDRITIIHGPNGVGKTTVLKLIHDLFSRKFLSLSSVPYKSISVSLDSDIQLTVTRVLEGPEDKRAKLLFEMRGETKFKPHEINPTESMRAMERHIPLSAIEEIIPYLDRAGPQKWVDRSTDEILSMEEVFLRYGDELPSRIRRMVRVPEELEGILKAVPINFIQTQRLFVSPRVEDYRPSYPPTRNRPTVERYSEEMIERMQEALRQSGTVAASLDRTFPNRLLETEIPSHATEKKIREIYEEQSKYRGRLMAAGLIDAQEPVPLPKGEVDYNVRKVLWHYLNDVNKKFEVFDPLLQKVELFKEIINTRFLYKSFSLDKREGFVFSSEESGKIPLRSLSSGEQHELVLSYELIFRVPQNSLILIDEPELSLHVTWQHRFLEDIARISQLVDLDFLIATHSPSIIHDRHNLMVGLPNNRNNA